MATLATLPLLAGCAPDDVRGDWYGSFAHHGVEAWTVRLFDLVEEGPTDDTSLGSWVQWTGTFEMWGSFDIASVEPWMTSQVPVPTEDIVASVVFWMCESEEGCGDANGDHPLRYYTFTAGPEGGQMVGEGTFDTENENPVANLNPLNGNGWWSNDAGETLTGDLHLAPAYAGLELGDPP